MSSKSRSNIILILLFVLAWLAVSTQLVLMINNRKADIPETIIRFFSFFTILTNLLVAIFATFKLFARQGHIHSLLTSFRTETAITIYIVIVGLVYNIILRSLWKPAGLQKVDDELLHTVVPLLFLAYWSLYVPKTQLVYKDILPWLIYPLVYCVYVLFRGYFSGFYPYPFIDLSILGPATTAINCGLLILVFVAVSLAFVAMGRLTARK